MISKNSINRKKVETKEEVKSDVNKYQNHLHLCRLIVAEALWCMCPAQHSAHQICGCLAMTSLLHLPH